MTNLTQLQQAITRIAKMDHAGVSKREIAKACGLDEAALDKVMDSAKFADERASIAGEAFDKQDVLNGSWDMVENLAMVKVVDHLQKAPDPDYALKAAALANKAIRRGKHENQPIGIQPNNQAVIAVSLNFAEKLQQNFHVHKKPTKELIKKDDNFLPPKSVQTLLTPKMTKEDKEREAIATEIGDLGMLMPAF